MSNQHSQVVVAYDFSHSGSEALYRAIKLATRAPFHILHFVCAIDPHSIIPAVPHHGPIDYKYAEAVQQALTDTVAVELRAAKVTDVVHFYVHARIGKPAEEILAVAKDVGADLIIIGSKGLTGVERLMLGSVSERVVREAGCTVEVARPKAYAYVNLVEVTDSTVPHHHYTPPHRYSYQGQKLNLRPSDWPLY